jgi:predicted N-acetyltransferase YhbS
MPATRATAPAPDVSAEIDLERPDDAAAIETIVARAFGPGRFVKTAERLREDSRPFADLSFVAREDGQVVGAVRLWPIRIGETPAALLGPIAVDGDHRREGLGSALVARACAAAEAKGLAAVLLVGDLPYFERFGFAPARVELPGPADPRRILMLVFRPLPVELDDDGKPVAPRVGVDWG